MQQFVEFTSDDATIILTTLGVVCLLLYSFIWMVIIKSYRKLQNTFYLYVISAGATDITALILVLAYSVPCIATQSEVYGLQIGRSFGFVHNCIIHDQSLCGLLIAFNRVRFALSTTYQRYKNSWAQRKRVLVSIMLRLLIPIALASVAEVIGCHWTFVYSGYHWDSNCTTTSYEWYVDNISIILQSITTAITAILYVVAWVKLMGRRRRQTKGEELTSTSRSLMRKEMRLLIQFTIISAISLISFAVSALSSLYSENYAFNIVEQIIDIVATSCNPIIYIAWDNGVRSAVLAVFHKQKTQVMSLEVRQ